jgi:anti-anti-sigma regulatory factor
MLRITEYRTSGGLVLKLEGRFCGCVVPELAACWQAARAGGGEHVIWVDLSDVLLVDAAGEALLGEMHRAGVRFVTRGCAMRELVREIAES